ncbi:DNA-3-methyladenine glycosylase 2 family protein [Halieaceae bacterium IMCC14734]|uniref:DNA-3-methyladenine glycosylase II n=1 Tax=Candidatus Litorirhabdus singularis TaxID=2518993 RepID=A0ABT3TB10_9GAMM|nr:AlkA N-terminal domain-containing protein [Candidatus Litorirhabdus singularis]MCX2979479.1 DNA-3-methyladenine glycosylase 2 family protein [Candidatus Litorirhabdus singularis]
MPLPDPDQLDPAICRQAHLSRDPRFDGQFFLAVTSTGIYCRPICPARTAKEDNVRYFASAAAAAQGGFRPCLRCRPESAPLSPAWRGTSTTLQRALKLIAQGALNQQSVAELSARLGIGERYLRKLFSQQLGVSPAAIARTQRLHFAQKLLKETGLSISEIAFASGFGSLRSCNAAFRQQLDCTPGSLRRTGERDAAASLKLELSFRPPYDWAGVLAFFGRHAVAGIETVDDNSYCRKFVSDGRVCSLRVSLHPRRNLLLLEPGAAAAQDLMPLVARIRRMFDLDASPADVAQTLAASPRLSQLACRFPGLRCPGHWSLFEAAVRGVVGQQISVSAARGVLAKLVRAAAPDGAAIFPTPAQILALSDAQLPMPVKRKATLRAVCTYFTDRDPDDDTDPRPQLLTIPGIGPWTVGMLGIRGLGDPDVFPDGDLILRRAYDPAGRLNLRELRAELESCKPWRSYAANLLWRSLSHDPVSN